MIATDVYSDQAPMIFVEFKTLIGENSWLAPARQFLEHTRRNSFLRDYYLAAHALTFELKRCSEAVDQYGGLYPWSVSHYGLERAVAFMVQSLSLLRAMPPKGRAGYVGRLRDALRRSDAMRGLLLEMSVATHFARKGHSVVWPELQPSHEAVKGHTFDIFVEDIGGAGLEVECKSVAHDKGRVLQKEAVLKFSEVLRKELAGVSGTLNGGLVVVLTVPDQLPSSPNQQKDLAANIRRAIVSDTSETLPTGEQIRVEPFPISRLLGAGVVADNESTRAVVDSITGTRNRSIVVMGRRNAGAIVVVLQSAKADTLLDAIERTARTARHQLSGTRPAMIVLGFDGIESEQLVEIAKQDSTSGLPPTVLAQAASSILGAAHCQHIIGVGFVSSTKAPRRDEKGDIAFGGVAYNFPNSGSPHWHADFAGLFKLGRA